MTKIKAYTTIEQSRELAGPLQQEKNLFENLYNNAIKDKGYQFLSDKSTAFYWFKKGKEL